MDHESGRNFSDSRLQHILRHFFTFQQTLCTTKEMKLHRYHQKLNVQVALRAAK